MGNMPSASPGCRMSAVCRYSGQDGGSNPTGMYAPVMSAFESASINIEQRSSNGFPNLHSNIGGVSGNEILKSHNMEVENITVGEPFKHEFGRRDKSAVQENHRKGVINHLNNRLKEQSLNNADSRDLNNNNNVSDEKMKENSYINKYRIKGDGILKTEPYSKFNDNWQIESKNENNITNNNANRKTETKLNHNSDKGETLLGSSVQSENNSWPSFVQDRIMEWDKLKSAYNEKNLHKSDKINVTLPDGEILCAYSWRIAPLDIAKDISRSLAKQVVMAIVDSQSWDMERPLEASCHLRLLKLNDRMAKDCYLDSTAHILGAALERLYGGHLCDHSSLESQFCFEIYLPDKDISSSDFPTIENTMYTIVGEEQPFERLHLSKEDVLRLFEDDEFKKQKVLEKVSTPTVTVYRCGSFIDLCEGPHVQHTGKIKAFKITERKVTSWKGDSSKQLLKVCGVSFENKKMRNEWEKQQDDIAKRDHRVIGRNQELFFFHEMSPGSPFFLPNGTHIYNKLIDFIEAEYRKRGYTNVITPNIFKSKLWEISGHWDHYHSNMFTFDVDEEKFALKPMNCPGHCLMYGFRPRSWRELPLRLADFGVLHRKEYSGGLSGLTRLYRFQQDDAHIFCAVNQIKSEIMAALEFLKHIYEVLGFELQLFLSTRPETFMGQSVLWDHAEKQLIESLNEFGMPWKENPGDGAFYGPKIDIIITDFLQRSHQCATIQLDFQLPIRFNLYYKSKKREMARPVIIHRAILGSVERMVAILAESYAGKWPFWLSPRQAIVLTITPAFEKYAANVHQQLFDAGFATSLDCNSSDTINKKIRNAQLDQFNFILVVGPREINTGTVNVRTRNNVVQGEFTVEEIIKKFHYLTEAKGSKDDCDMKHI